MDSELAELLAFVQGVPPFDHLPLAVCEQLVDSIRIVYLRRGGTMPPPGIDEARYYMVRKGLLIQSLDNEETVEFGPGDLCSEFASTHQASAIISTAEDSLLYSIEADRLGQLIADYPDVRDFLSQDSAQRLRHRPLLDMPDASVDAVPLASLCHGPIVSIDADQSIASAAQLMTEKSFSSLVVTVDGEPVGIVTDKDIRRRCVAAGLVTDASVRRIASNSLITIAADRSLDAAVEQMVVSGIHHLPVERDGRLIGMLTSTDLINHDNRNTVNYASLIKRADSIDTLASICAGLPELQLRLQRLGTHATSIAKQISAVCRLLTIRIVELVEAEIGPAPVPWAWVAAGSMARQEMLVNSDQDNALIIDNSMQKADATWFESLAQKTCDALNRCGFVYCPGNVMASNPQWRQTQSQWQDCFRRWIHTPEPKALMHCSIFFDLDCIYGDKTLLATLQDYVIAECQGRTLFFAHMTANALQHRPPLSVFRKLQTIGSGEHRDSIDIKHNGIAPIVDLARIYALQEGIKDVNTSARIQAVAGSPSLSQSYADSLQDAFELLQGLRVEHQTRQLRQRQQANNFLPVNEMSKLQREYLKDAFRIIKTLQDSRQAVY